MLNEPVLFDLLLSLQLKNSSGGVVSFHLILVRSRTVINEPIPFDLLLRMQLNISSGGEVSYYLILVRSFTMLNFFINFKYDFKLTLKE